MSRINWDDAPDGAMCFNGGKFWKVRFSSQQYSYYCKDGNKWVLAESMTKQDDYEAHPVMLAKSRMLAGLIEAAESENEHQ